MQGEHRPSLSEYMWAHTQESLLNSNSNLRKKLTEDQIRNAKTAMFETIKTQEDIANKVR
jgi:hypothetical protein